MMRSLIGLLLSVTLGGVALAQFAGPSTPAGPADPSASMGAPPSYASEPVSASAPAPVRTGGGYDYRLGSGDQVRIIVFGEDSLGGTFDVPGAGVISLPLVGDVKAAGLTVGELAAQIEVKLRDGYLKDPHVSIEVLNYRPFYILGEVMKPGEYPYTNGLTVLNAVATANGFTYRANTHKVYIKRANSAGEIEYELRTSTPVEPGDTIRIGERFF